MKVVFAGSGAFGVPTLHALCRSGLRPALVVSQPDRPAGRSRAPAPNPLAAEARALDLPLFQPERLNRPGALDRLRAEAPDVLVVVAYGQILKPAALAVPRVGCVNVHGSLLPRHRGASPVQAAILAGDAETGVTIMLMDEGLDSGPVLAMTRTPIGADETAGDLHDRLAELGAPLLVAALRGLEAGTVRAEPQDAASATTCGLIRKGDGALDWSLPAEVLDRRIRAFTPWPGAATTLPVRGKPLPLTVEKARPESAGPARAPAGTVIEAAGARLVVACGSGALSILRVRPAGKRSQDVEEFLKGYPVAAGARAGSGGAEDRAPAGAAPGNGGGVPR